MQAALIAEITGGGYGKRMVKGVVSGHPERYDVG